MEYKVNNLLYASGSDMLGTLRCVITLNEPVNKQVLENALKKAAVRFPYFSVKLVKHEEEYRMVTNDLPFVISPNGQTVTLGTEESNYHLFAFAYDGCRLYVDTSHFITDGYGKTPFMLAILYFYLVELHPDETFDPQMIEYFESAASDAEADDAPYPDDLLPEESVGNNERPEKVFMLQDQMNGYEYMDQWTSFVYLIKQKDLMAYVSGLDGSPVTFIASMLYWTITECHPENRLPIVCGVQHQFRNALGKPFSHLCHVNIVPIIFHYDFDAIEVEKLNTMARGQLMIVSDDSNDVLTVNEHIRNDRMIRNMDLSQKQEYMQKAIRKGIGTNTFEISYTGRVPWGGMDKYVKNLIPYLDLTLSGGISIEIFSVGDSFGVNIMQRNGDTKYVDRFSYLLDEMEVHYTAEAPEHFKLCGIKLPD